MAARRPRCWHVLAPSEAWARASRGKGAHQVAAEEKLSKTVDAKTPAGSGQEETKGRGDRQDGRDSEWPDLPLVSGHGGARPRSVCL
jgi:hypothetical protein